MVTRPPKKKTSKTLREKTKTPSKSNIVKREPTPAIILKKVATVSDSESTTKRDQINV